MSKKRIQANRTGHSTSALHGEERLIELAQMLGGVSDGTLQSARELLANGKQDTLDFVM